MSNAMRGFDGAGMAVGTVTGVRWWSLYEAKLTGARAPWEPGENTATCRALRLRHDPAGLPDEDCGCGFWGYWQPGSAPQAGSLRPVLGIIDGYGNTAIGDLGFRSAKAKIVALCCMFTAQRPDPGRKAAVASYKPDEALFWRGPGGMPTWRALTGRGYAPELPMIDDPEMTAAVQNQLEYDYQVPVYTSAEAMLLRHPPTTDYLPEPFFSRLPPFAAGASDWRSFIAQFDHLPRQDRQA